jgi:hypothetical protein
VPLWKRSVRRRSAEKLIEEVDYLLQRYKIRSFEFWIVIALAGLMILASPAQAADYKYCGQPKRDANGVIVRSTAAKAAFRAEVACPSTGLFTGACPGWSIDHTWPLASCGCDSITNMAWLKNTIKTFLDSRSITPYRFQRDCGIASNTAYSLYNHPDQLPSSTVLSKICDAYKVQPGLLLLWVDEGETE